MDRIAAAEFDKAITERLRLGERNIVVDLAGLEYISSAGLRSFLAASQQLKDEGQIRLCALGGLVREVFNISGFESIFHVYPSVEEALKSA